MKVSDVTPMPGWVLCRMLEPETKTDSGLVLARDMKDGKTSEGVCEVLEVTPPQTENGRPFPLGFGVGDRIVFREFLKAGNPVGNMLGEDRDDSVFLLHYRDVLAVVPEGASLSLGHWGEFSIK